MSQQEVAEILKKASPNLLSHGQIAKRIGISRNSVMRNLRSLIKREEIVYVMVASGDPQGHWIRKYGIQEENEHARKTRRNK